MKAMAFLVKLPELTDAAFFAHWRHPHGTMTRRIPQFRRYVQNHRIGDVPGLAGGDWLGVPAIWVDDLASLAAAQAHPDYAPLDADGDKMYIRDRALWLVGDETVLAGQQAGADTMPVKAMLLIGDGSTPIAADAADELARRLADALPDSAGASATVPADPTAHSACAALVEISFPDRAAFDAAWGDGDAVLPLIADAADLSSCHGLLVREERVIWPDAAAGDR